MNPRSDGFPARLLVAVLFLAWLMAIGLAAAESSSSTERARTPATPASASAPAKSVAQPAAQAGYVGADTCLTCHEDKKNLGEHGRAANPRTPMAGQGCETCHGPGQAHVDAGGDTALIRNPATLTPSEVSAICTTCHNRGEH